MRRPLLLLLLLFLMAGCGSPKPSEALGAEAKLLTQAKVDGATVMLGALSSGEWVLATTNGKDDPNRAVLDLQEGKPLYRLASGIAMVAGRAPEGADRYELLTDERNLLKGKVVDGVYLIAWTTNSAKPAFLLRILNAKGEELYRWPPPGAVPAA